MSSEILDGRPFRHSSWLLLGLLMALLASTSWGESRPWALPDTRIALPMKGEVKLEWVIPPSTDPEVIAGKYLRMIDDLRFMVDTGGHPWITTDRRRVLIPTRQRAFDLSESFQNMVALDNGGVLFATLRHLGTIAFSEPTAGGGATPAVLPFQPFTPLPRLGARLYQGNFRTLYAVTDEPGGGSAVYRIGPEPTRRGTEEVQRWVKVLTTDRPVTAVAGTGKITWVALGRTVFRHDADTGRWLTQAVAPAAVRQLVRMVDGLFCATKDQVGYLGDNRQIFFLQTPSPLIAEGLDNRLYVLFPNTMGVAALENLSAFRDLDAR